MAKRVIQECDLTKQEYDPDETVTLVIKKKGKQAGRTYELSANAAAKLEQQLVAGTNALLKDGWYFANEGVTSAPTEGKQRVTLGDLEASETQPDDSKFVSQKKAELREAGVLAEGERETPDEPVIVEAPRVSNGCRHLNKGRIQTTLKGGKRFVYRMCTDCRTKLPEMTTEEKRSYMDGKPDGDVRVRSLEPN